MWRRSFFLGLCVFFLLRAPLSYGEALTFESGPDRTTLLELYTSEGCSSCPSAEEWISRLQSSHDLWKKLVPVAYHVDYWDNLGWKDILSSQAYSNLQRAYARRWGLSSVYTPMFVKNGSEYRDWFSQESVPRSFRKKTGMLFAEALAGGQWKVTYQPQPSMDLRGDFYVHAALLGFDIRSLVTSGENSGRELTHDFTVLDLRKGRLSLKGNRFEALVVLNRNSEVSAKKRGLAVWVTGPQEQILQALGGYLPEEK